MNYIEKYIGKDLRELNLEDLKSYFSKPKQESDTVEYKSYYIKHQNNHKHKESAIFKTICGLLNSEGGMIIWGAPIEQINKDTKLKEYHGELSRIDTIIDKDTFISKVSQLITPVPSGIIIEVIDEGKYCVCVIQVQKSMMKPHRYSDRYWMRLDGQTHVAPHHYIEALMKEIKYPNIEGYVRLTRYKTHKSNSGGGYLNNGDKYLLLNFKIFIVNFSPFINETMLPERVSINKGFFENYNSEHINFHQNNTQYSPLMANRILHYGDPIETDLIVVIKQIELENNTEFKILLEFSGEKSPLKHTIMHYQINKKKDEIKVELDFATENIFAFDLAHHEKKNFLKMLNELYDL